MQNFKDIPEIAEEAIESFIGLYPGILSSIEAAILRYDFKELELKSHLLRGVVSNFHAYTAQALAEQLEQMGKQHKTGKSKEIFFQLKIEIENLRIALQDTLKGAA